MTVNLYVNEDNWCLKDELWKSIEKKNIDNKNQQIFSKRTFYLGKEKLWYKSENRKFCIER